ncbi:non-hydrolyzing UDP-N-acetylglucosamine 2-epimerase [Alcanivorax jadensis]|uniref:non-hydrolyzing UDP-N-acetylglucosamine 2-epimerase n=1 Tax=Alcanivorax jadensis TaxID=64988 RepID=UPI0018DC8A8E|nr:UDP-N-acetylglucosamine 2-epimerase (non-hydrolyzing) [Alcanivorax jadensis]
MNEKIDCSFYGICLKYGESVKRVAIVLGTRPEAIKLLPVYKAMQESSVLEPVLVSTGQHREMLLPLFDVFGVEPDFDLQIMTKNQTLSSLTARLFETLGALFDQQDFFSVLVQGDTTTALVGAVVGYYHKINICHVEAGLRTSNKWSPFPEECNRKMIGSVADFHFTPTSTATNALIKEGIVDGVFEVGNTVIDSLLYVQSQLGEVGDNYQNKYRKLLGSEKRMILVTGHRRESFGDGLKNICIALKKLVELYEDIVLVYPVHLNPNVRNIVADVLGGESRIKLIDPVPYTEMVYLMGQSWLILTDSGGIQEEAPSLGVPVLVMRDTTERQEGVDAGCALLLGTSIQGILDGVASVIDSPERYQSMVNSQNPYGDGLSSARIVSALEERSLMSDG